MVVDVFCSSGAPAVMSCPKTPKAPSCTFRPSEHAHLCLHELHGVLEVASPAGRVCTRTWAFKTRSTSARSDHRLPLEILQSGQDQSVAEFALTCRNPVPHGHLSFPGVETQLRPSGKAVRPSWQRCRSRTCKREVRGRRRSAGTSRCAAKLDRVFVEQTNKT